MPGEYDVVSKVLLLESTGLVARTLFGGEVAEWLSAELPNVRNPRADAVVRRVDGQIAHVELQAKNDPEMAERMFDYYGALRRRFKRDVPQTLLYLGPEQLRMPHRIIEPRLHYEYRLIDIREFSGEDLIASADIADNLLAVLTDAGRDKVIRRVLERIEAAQRPVKEQAAQAFMILSKLRGHTGEFSKEIPMLDIKELLRDDEMVLEIAAERAAKTLARQLERRFGPNPEWVTERLASATEEQLTRWEDRFATASSRAEVFLD